MKIKIQFQDINQKVFQTKVLENTSEEATEEYAYNQAKKIGAKFYKTFIIKD